LIGEEGGGRGAGGRAPRAPLNAHTHPTPSPSAIDELKSRGHVRGGQQVAIVQSGRQPIWRSASTHAIQVRRVPRDPDPEE
jgi:hypothetical protein